MQQTEGAEDVLLGTATVSPGPHELVLGVVLPGTWRYAAKPPPRVFASLGQGAGLRLEGEVECRLEGERLLARVPFRIEEGGRQLLVLTLALAFERGAEQAFERRRLLHGLAAGPVDPAPVISVAHLLRLPEPEGP